MAAPSTTKNKITINKLHYISEVFSHTRERKNNSTLTGEQRVECQRDKHVGSARARAARDASSPPADAVARGGVRVGSGVGGGRRGRS
jgi:hypothetical protein